MVSQPGKSKTRLCLLLGVAIVLFHVTLTTPVLAKAEQHPLDTTHTTPKASKDHSKNSIPNKLPKNKKANKKFAQKSPSKKDTSSLADMVLEATKMDAASLQNSISGLWDNVVQFGKQGAPAFQAEIDQVLKKEHIDLSKIQGGRNLEQQEGQHQKRNNKIEIMALKHRRHAQHRDRQGRKNKKGGQRVGGGNQRKNRHRKGAGRRRGGRHQRKGRQVGDRVPKAPPVPVVAPVQSIPDAPAPAPMSPPASPANNDQPNVDAGAPATTGDTDVPGVAPPSRMQPGHHHIHRRPRPTPIKLIPTPDIQPTTVTADEPPAPSPLDNDQVPTPETQQPILTPNDGDREPIPTDTPPKVDSHPSAPDMSVPTEPKNTVPAPKETMPDHVSSPDDNPLDDPDDGPEDEEDDPKDDKDDPK
ncbi:hypothetical protein BGZ59_005954, partial [Podila verticillata]